MSTEITYISVKMEKGLKDSFLRLCKEEGIDISQATRELLIEAMARGFINKDRKERIQKAKALGGANA